MTDTTRPGPGQGGNSLDVESVDDLLSVVLQLTADVSALRERVSIWERVLEARGIRASEAVRGFVGTALQAPLPAAERERLLRDALDSLRSHRRPHGD